jgi:hypothetical protein
MGKEMTKKFMIFTSENRRSQRIPAPVGTTVLIKNSAGYLDTLYVQDISVVGMLVNGYISEERYPLDTSLKGILLNIPPCELNAHSRISLLINEGKVVHSLVDQVSKTVCYGIEFMNESSYVKETLESLVNKIRPNS